MSQEMMMMDNTDQECTCEDDLGKDIQIEIS